MALKKIFIFTFSAFLSVSSLANDEIKIPMAIQQSESEEEQTVSEKFAKLSSAKIPFVGKSINTIAKETKVDIDKALGYTSAFDDDRYLEDIDKIKSKAEKNINNNKRKNIASKARQAIATNAICNRVNQIHTVEGSENDAYADISVGCDLGLEMPGLPSLSDFNINIIGKLDMCKAVQSITGPMVAKFNENVTAKIDSKLDEVTDKINENLTIDLGDIVGSVTGNDELGNALFNDDKFSIGVDEVSANYGNPLLSSTDCINDPGCTKKYKSCMDKANEKKGASKIEAEAFCTKHYKFDN